MNATFARRRPILAWLPLAVVTLGGATTWAIFLGGGLRSIFAWLALQTLVPLGALALVVGTIAHALWKRRGASRVAVTLGVGLVGLWPAAWLAGQGRIAYPYRLAATSPSATVRLPTDAPMRVLWGGDDLAHNRHAMMPDQRWAYDLVVEPALTSSERLEDYGCWVTPVVAPISGTVHLAHDGEIDQVLGRPSNELRAPLGNHVAIALPSGGFLLVAHLQKGSVVAREGEPIAEGTPIGRCGNSGNTSEPHVHIHAQRQDPRGRPVNFSEGLPLFFRDHDGAPMPLGGADVVEDGPVAAGAIVRHLGGARAAAARE